MKPTMPAIHRILTTTALCLAAVGVNSCQQTKKVAPDITGSFLTYTHLFPLATEPPAVYRLNEAESRELAKLEALIHPDTPYLDLLPASAQPTFIIYPANGEAKQLDFYLYAVSIPQLSAKVNALVDKIKSRPGAQLQGEELSNWKEHTKYHQQD